MPIVICARIAYIGANSQEHKLESFALFVCWRLTNIVGMYQFVNIFRKDALDETQGSQLLVVNSI